jgi:homoserine dehydrogenase
VSESLKVAIAGLGTVGAGTVKLLQEQAELVSARCGRAVTVTAVSARTAGRDRGFDMTGITWFDDAVEMAEKADADVVVELIGGSDGIAKRCTETALKAGRHVVTANKAMIAHHGTELAQMAEDAGVTLAYEAAVAGGIPVIKALREGLAGNRISSLYGILNGTCNYILTTMRETGREFGDVLEEAQALGYAEADPSFDIDGVDAAHKLAILASLAFGSPVNFEAVTVQGIRNITSVDIEYAELLGYRLKLLGIASETEYGVEQRVHPTMVPINGPIAAVEGVYNAVVTEGDYVGRTVLEGRGAGAGPTASAVVADIMDIASGRHGYAFGVPVKALRAHEVGNLDELTGAYYIRLQVMDVPGVFADIAAALRDAEVSMEQILQRGRAPGEIVPVVMTVYEVKGSQLRQALERIEALDAVVEPPHVIRIEEL